MFVMFAKVIVARMVMVVRLLRLVVVVIVKGVFSVLQLFDTVWLVRISKLTRVLILLDSYG
jgi:hypothetical protein